MSGFILMTVWKRIIVFSSFNFEIKKLEEKKQNKTGVEIEPHTSGFGLCGSLGLTPFNTVVCSLHVHWMSICTLIFFKAYIPFTEQELGILICLFYIIVFICEGIQTGNTFLWK